MSDHLLDRLREALIRRDGAAIERLLSSRVRLVVDTGDEEGQVVRVRRRVVPVLLRHASSHRCARIGVEGVNGSPAIVLRAESGDVIGVVTIMRRRCSVTDVWIIAAPGKLGAFRHDDPPMPPR